ncbi:hypothetical protein U1701_13100 [Sphingomonas sp. PB2P19]|uniref:hypothetical protein n=1 Tax=Sphingomonas rhamnosi TaxID=3096156 RepID=UPI002FCC6950
MPYDTSPTIYNPVAGDNGPGIRALITSGKRWIQINAPAMTLDTRIDMLDADGNPSDYLWIEPAPSIDKVIIDTTGIGRDPVQPTNPSYAGFEYNGKFTPAGYLSADVATGDLSMTVNNGALYAVGAWVFLSDASTNPGVTLQPLDGTVEIMQVAGKTGNVLTVDRPFKRAHVANTIAALTTPIRGLKFSNLIFTGNSKGGIHAHCSFGGFFDNITTQDWRGGYMLLLDLGGRDNTVADCFCTGTEAGGPDDLEKTTWGVALEGQDSSKTYRSGGTLCGTGLTMNACIDTVSYDSIAYQCNVNVGIYTSSIRTYFIQPQTTNFIALDTYVEAESATQDCAIIGRKEYSVPAIEGEQQFLDPRDLPVDGLAATDRVLAFDENGLGKQVPKNRLVTVEADGTYSAEVFEIKSVNDVGGNLRASNTGHSWLVGMLGVAGANDFVIYDLTRGVQPLLIDGTTGAIKIAVTFQALNGGVTDLGASTTPWKDAYLNGFCYTGTGVKVATLQVLGARKGGWAVDTGTAKRTTNATYAAGATLTFSAAYVQSEQTAVATRLAEVEAALQSATQTIKAMKDDLHSSAGHGLFGA